MLLSIRQVLTDAQLARCRELMDRATWVDGRVTAGHQSALAKDNRQIPEGAPEAREIGETIVAALERHPLFISAALPLRVFPPLFNRYEGGIRSAPTWTTPSGRSPAPRTGSARTCRRRCS